MIIIAGYSRTQREKRDAAVAEFAEMIERARKQDGCLDLAISSDPVDLERINILECWRDQQSWNAWRKVAKAPRFRARETHVSLYRSERAEKPF